MGWWSLTKKDLKLQIRDRRALAVLLLLPLIFISIVGLSTGRLLGWKASNQIVKVAWVDRDGGDLVKRVRDKLHERSEVDVVDFPDRTTAESAVFKNQCTLLLTVGPELHSRIDELELKDFFARKENKGRLAAGLTSLDISVETKPGWSWISRLVSDTLFSLVLEEAFPTVVQKHNIGQALMTQLKTDAESDEIQSRLAVKPPAPNDAIVELKPPPRQRLTSLEPRHEVQPSVSDGDMPTNSLYGTLIPGFTVMFSFFLVNVMARSFIAERDIGTLKRLRLAPMSPSHLLIGKTLPFFVISLMQSVALFVFGRLLFNMPWGKEPWLLLPIIVSTSLAATSLGLLIATSVRTDSQVSSYSNLIVISCAGISGCFLPRDWMPDLMRQISLVTPHAWSLTAYGEALLNPVPALTSILQSCAVLWLFSALFFATGCWRFRGLS